MTYQCKNSMMHCIGFFLHINMFLLCMHPGVNVAIIRKSEYNDWIIRVNIPSTIVSCAIH